MKKEFFILGLLILSFMASPVLGITIPGTGESFSTTIPESNIQITKSSVQPQFPNQGESGGIKQWIWEHLPDSIKNCLPGFVKNFLKPKKEALPTPEEVTPIETPLKPPKVSITAVKIDDLIDGVKLPLFQMQEDLCGKLDIPTWQENMDTKKSSLESSETGSHILRLTVNNSQILALFRPGEIVPYRGSIILPDEEIIFFDHDDENNTYEFSSPTLTKLSLIGGVKLPLFQMQKDLGGKLDIPDWQEIDLSEKSDWKLNETTGQYILFLTVNESPITAVFKPDETIPYEGAVFLDNKEVVNFTYDYENGEYTFNSPTLTKLSLIDGVKFPLFQLQKDLAGKLDIPDWQKNMDITDSFYTKSETVEEYTLFLSLNDSKLIAQFKLDETIPYEGSIKLPDKNVVNFTYDYEERTYDYSY